MDCLGEMLVIDRVKINKKFKRKNKRKNNVFDVKLMSIWHFSMNVLNI